MNGMNSVMYMHLADLCCSNRWLSSKEGRAATKETEVQAE